jgi:hypothetical protein
MNAPKEDMTMGSGVTRDLQETNSSMRDSSYVQVRQDRVQTTDGGPLDPTGLAREIDCSEGQFQVLLLVSFCSKLLTVLNYPNYQVIAAWTAVNRLQQHYNAICMG